MYDDKDYIKPDGNKYLWSPELSASVSYTVKPIQTKLNLFYNIPAAAPVMLPAPALRASVLYVAETAANLADFTFNTVLNKYITVFRGVKNILM